MHIPRRDVLSVVGQLRHRPTDKQKGYKFTYLELWLGGDVSYYKKDYATVWYLLLHCRNKKRGQAPVLVDLIKKIT
jgi:hypothetical protein